VPIGFLDIYTFGKYNHRAGIVKGKLEQQLNTTSWGLWVGRLGASGQLEGNYSLLVRPFPRRGVFQARSPEPPHSKPLAGSVQLQLQLQLQFSTPAM